MELNDHQTTLIQALLDKSSLSYTPFKEELLDHICTDIENKMKAGISFPSAIAQAFDTFPEDEIKEIEQQIITSINQNNSMMKKVSFMALGCLLLLSTMLWANEQDPPDVSPLSKTFAISSGFGNRMHPVLKVEKMHRGIDMAAPTGTPVMATAAGEIIEVEEKYGYGLCIIIKHDDVYQTLYAQLSEFNVKKGQMVKKGDIIGKVGSSGISTAPHLHYEVLKNGMPDDPENYLKP
ncbi:MAG: M23 family metallopeptidase [Saprospiraceae bacterium]